MAKDTKRIADKPLTTDSIKFKYWHKLTLAFCAMTVLVLSVVMIVIHNRVDKMVTEHLEEQLLRLEDSRKKLSDNMLMNLSHRVHELMDPSIIAIINESSGGSSDLFGDSDEDSMASFKEYSSKLHSRLKPRSLFHEFQVFMLLNRNGEILLNKNKIELAGESLANWPIILDAIDGSPHAFDWWKGNDKAIYVPEGSERKLYWVHAVPIQGQDREVFGVVILGNEIGAKYFKQFREPSEDLKREMGMELQLPELAFVQKNRILATSLSDWERKDNLEAQLKSVLEQGRKIRVNLLDEVYIAVATKIADNKRDVGHLLLFKNLTQPLNRDMQKFFWMLIVIAAACLVMTVILSMLLARLLTAAIQTIIVALQKIGHGDFSVRVDLRNRDELGLLAKSFNKMSEDLETGEFIETAMQKYVSKDVVDNIKENRSSVELGGSKEKLSFLFSDIESFTSISERMEPPVLIKWLNEYLTAMSQPLKKHEGHLDKFVGDAVIAFWNAPKRVDDHPNKAAMAALEMIRILKGEQAEKWQAHYGIAPMCRIGLHIGDVIVGNVGSEDRLNYTAIGDSMNVAARLESANKKYRTNIMISEEFKSELDERFICRPLDKIVVVGKTQPITVYELMEEEKNLTAEEILFCEMFTQMMQLYWRREFLEALEMCENSDIKHPSLDVYIKRCREFLENPPAENWQGEHVLTSK